MDRAKQKKIRNIRVILTNIFMSISVVAIVFVLMLIAMGFSFNAEGKLEQAGLLQLNSYPSGASVEIDKSTQFGHTEFRKMLSAGKHSVYVDKEGYDHWEQDVNIDAGLFTRVAWIRLFPKNADISNVSSFKPLRLSAFSPDRRWLIAAEQDSSDLIRINIQDEKLKHDKISLANLLSTSTANAQTGTIEIEDWNENCNKILVRWTRDEETTTWHLLDLEHSENSINLSSKLSLDFTDVQIMNDSASKLWALESGKLHSIDLDNLSISGPIAENVIIFAHNRDTLAFVSTGKDEETGKTKRYLMTYKEGEKGSTHIRTLSGKKDFAVRLAMGSHWNEEWIALQAGSDAVIYSGRYPSFGKDETDKLKVKLEQSLEFTPNILTVNQKQRIIVFADETSYFYYDIETEDNGVVTLKNNIASVDWFDDYLLWTNVNNKIVVRDFDGSNRRTVAKKASANRPSVVSENNHWLYYFSETEEKVTLKRYKID
ncbi:PEGA domain-containing protein [Candidatus Saccharibacteria bacterium]|nr:PEGA domain-containing protein [Candidatus Saccharibacteria bacterium]